MKKSYIEESYLANNAGTDGFEIIKAGLDDICKAICREVFDKHMFEDFPLIIAGLEAIAQGLRNVIGENGNELADIIKSGISMAIIDGSELQRQMKGRGK